MSVRKFKFVSPGVQVAEIDNSQLPNVSSLVGPVVVGRARRGPALRPVKVESFSEWINVFGDPIPGGRGGDVWRDGNQTAPTYGAYAAQAWLRNNSPLTYVRLLGAQHEDNTTAGQAGWETKDSGGDPNGLGPAQADGGAYGLFIIDSGSSDITAGVNTSPTTGALAAVFYVQNGSIVLTGSLRGGTSASGSAALIQSIGADKEFRAIVRDGSNNVVKTTTFNFNKNSKKYIRRVFNTNPILTNTDITTNANVETYWLGPTYERHLDTLVTGSGAGENFGVILGLKGNAGTKEGSDFRFGTQAPKTGWFFGQDLQSVTASVNSYSPSQMTKLFRLVGIDTGEWTQQNIKVSIQDIKASTNPADPYGTFTVILRKAEDADNAVRIVERFSNCTLNPFSEDYIGKKIGDMYVTWDDDGRRYREYGNYPNRSRFVRVDVNQDVDRAATDPELLPFGVFGPPRHKGFTILGGVDEAQAEGTSTDGSDFTAVHAQGNTDIVRTRGTAGLFIDVGGVAFSYTGSFQFPKMTLRSSSADGNLANQKLAYFGLDSSLNSTSTRPDPGYSDYVRPMPSGYDSFAPNGTETEYSWIFTLDDLSGSGINAVHNSGSRAAGTSLTAVSSDNYRAVLTQGFNRFTSPLFGGFDGLDITEKEPFNNTDLNGGAVETNYAFNSAKRAIDAVADPELVEMNILAVPGITEPAITDHALNVCEDRRDALAIMDLAGGFLPHTENTLGDNSATNRGDVATTIDNLRDRAINSSYGCAYYPWVQVRDTINNQTLWSPPSVVALGVMAASEKRSELWFAPAGFNRGGLTEGSAGIPVVGVRQRLTKDERDDLYAANINPIASFPNQGIVVFGQKTLQVTPSALDRINVRRLLIHLKKEISRFANSILFDPNVRVTWNRFLGKVKPFLESIQTRFGLSDFRIVLDETTTTPELVDRNVLYAKVFLKPTRAIEFIGVDFVITDSGASFDD